MAANFYFLDFPFHSIFFMEQSSENKGNELARVPAKKQILSASGFEIMCHCLFEDKRKG